MWSWKGLLAGIVTEVSNIWSEVIIRVKLRFFNSGMLQDWFGGADWLFFFYRGGISQSRMVPQATLYNSVEKLCPFSKLSVHEAKAKFINTLPPIDAISQVTSLIPCNKGFWKKSELKRVNMKKLRLWAFSKNVLNYFVKKCLVHLLTQAETFLSFPRVEGKSLTCAPNFTWISSKLSKRGGFFIPKSCGIRV